MSENTAIEWTDATWNPVTGCTKVSPGCAHCYIERTPPFRMEGRRFVRPQIFTRGRDADGNQIVLTADEMTTGVRLHPDRLDQPLRWRKPRRIFVSSLADLFHDDVPDEYIACVFDRMREASHSTGHTFQVLTKRPERMRDVLARLRFTAEGERGRTWVTNEIGTRDGYALMGGLAGCRPLPNVWLGVSIENARYTWRADVLREIPAAVRFISAEPLLGSLLADDEEKICHECDTELYLGHDSECSGTPDTRRRKPLDLSGIDWVITGAESGPRARVMDEGWVRELRDACLTTFFDTGARPSFFYKQAAIKGRKVPLPELDGRQWTEMPGDGLRALLSLAATS